MDTATDYKPTSAAVSKKVILVAEDEAAMVRLLRDNLTYEGYEVLVAADGEVAVETALRTRPDLILLDIMLPKLDGLSVCRQLRESHLDTPIIMLTARNLEQDKITGLKIGADDYMTKPFSISELLARTEATLRRTDRKPCNTFTFGAVCLNFGNLTATKRGVEIELSPREFNLLRYLVENRGRVISRTEMLARVWHLGGGLHTRTVDTHILNLRQKVEDTPSSPSYIQTVHRIGYRFNA
jgi:two-component system, OmpR family, alkaline phosphatase synthesis response regulator PhoP